MGNKVEQQMASSLVGKSVIMKTNESSSGMIAGKVNYWENIDGKIYLGINGKLYDIADVDTVLDNDYYDKLVNGNTSKKDDTTSGSGKADDTSFFELSIKPLITFDVTIIYSFLKSIFMPCIQHCCFH